MARFPATRYPGSRSNKSKRKNQPRESPVKKSSHRKSEAHVFNENALQETNVVAEQPDEVSLGTGMVDEQDAFSESSSEGSNPNGEAQNLETHSRLLQSLVKGDNDEEPKRKKQKVGTVQSQPMESGSNNGVEADFTSEASVDEDNESEVFDELDDDDHDHNDPFTRHLEGNDEALLSQKIAKVENNQWHTQKSPQRGSLQMISRVPHLPHGSTMSQESAEDYSLHLKDKLKHIGDELLINLDPSIRSFLHPAFNYQDVLFPCRSLANANHLRQVMCLHTLNHVFKTRNKVIKNKIRLARDEGKQDIEYRDQGFTRPKILIILPTRQSCVRYVETLVKICQPDQQENRKRFQESFDNGSDNFADNKPVDFRELFAGNDDDMFRLGLKFTRKTIKYFASFYKSDIILASPLGIRMAIGGEDPKKQDYDFLSSIEIAIFDQCNALSMQNWEHSETIFENLNLQPRQARDCDFSRVRSWYLDGNAKFLRQTILLSAFNFPALNRLFTRHMLNVAGKTKFYTEEKGAMLEAGVSAKQTFSRFDSPDPSTEPDVRFDYFSSAILPNLIKQLKQHGANSAGVLLFIPSYADFVRLRNHLAGSSNTQDIPFGSISEYSPVKEVARARSHFMTGNHAILLYTERAHHFRRYHLKGVKKIIMYGLPENPIFFKEIVGEFLGATLSSGGISPRETSVRVIFSKWDMLKLERVVGSDRYISMLKDRTGDVFDFV